MDQITPSSYQQPQRLLIHQQHHQNQQHQQLYGYPQQQLSPVAPLGSTPYYSEAISPTHTSPPASATGNWPPHRTSNTREELHTRLPQQQYYQQQVSVKREPLAATMSDKMSAGPSSGLPQPATRTPEDPMPSTSDFVKKLYKCICSFFVL